MHWRRKWQPSLVFLPGESQGWGAWWAAVYGVAQSRTWWKWLSSSSSSNSNSGSITHGRKYFLYLLYILYVIHFPYLEKYDVSRKRKLSKVIHLFYHLFINICVCIPIYISLTCFKAKLPIIRFHFSMGESIFPMFTC